MNTLTEAQHQAQLLRAALAKRRALFAHYDVHDSLHVSIRNLQACREAQKGRAT